ncbi:prepilin-type N-terminal cleavage/methylation domain-containing protein [Desulfosporosinus acidiphilus SJ4]|uniref:Prepilin-type N-terminal cleavage/methylation domain-containing protein n=2 Tax=Desulfosporosinus TaxID=79206 RepID=I4D950_DESAJ|nr:prepilin-type N-terminal cleavage/methylation domain-containing protein [Desulfosporosinus acidiphilus SJ4]
MKRQGTIQNSTRGFTLLEVMIALSIFSLLLLYASQFMHSEISGYNSASKQNELEQKERIAMMQLLDELRLNCYTYFKSTSTNQGIYQYANAAAAASESQGDNDPCLIFIQTPDSEDQPPPSTKIFFEYDQSKAAGSLWYLKDEFNKYLIADDIAQINLTSDAHDERMVKINITVGGHNDSQPYELMTWARLN